MARKRRNREAEMVTAVVKPSKQTVAATTAAVPATTSAVAASGIAQSSATLVAASKNAAAKKSNNNNVAPAIVAPSNGHQAANIGTASVPPSMLLMPSTESELFLQAYESEYRFDTECRDSLVSY